MKTRFSGRKLPIGMQGFILIITMVSAGFMPACMEIGEPDEEWTENDEGEEYDPAFAEIEGAAKTLMTDAQLKVRCDKIKERAALKGITNPLLIAGLGYHETGLSQCVSEYALAYCSNVGTSFDCPAATGVLGGKGDCNGDCAQKCGGIGMFQLDGGTYQQTLNTYGTGILNVAGNADTAVQFVINKLGFSCEETPCFDQNPGVKPCPGKKENPDDVALAVAWFNSIKPGTPDYDKFMHAAASCYNNCKPGYTCAGGKTHDQITALYKDATNELHNKFSAAYWYPPTTCSTLGPFSGSGSGGGSGSKCLNTYSFNTVAGKKYTISTCGNYTGDPYVKVTGSCKCEKDDFCALGAQCDCTAESTGVATVCASTYSNAAATWNYSVVCNDGAACSGAGPFSGFGSKGGSGATCLNSYNFNVIAGKQYKISTCGYGFTGDPYLKVTGACSCPPTDDVCGLGPECTCTALTTGTATICASTYDQNSASWNYAVTCL